MQHISLIEKVNLLYSTKATDSPAILHKNRLCILGFLYGTITTKLLTSVNWRNHLINIRSSQSPYCHLTDLQYHLLYRSRRPYDSSVTRQVSKPCLFFLPLLGHVKISVPIKIVIYNQYSCFVI